MKNFNVVILAAGLGSRLGKSHPKCLTLLTNGDTILQQQIKNIRTVFGEKTKITVVVGYQAEKIIENYPDLSYVYNENYDSTNTSKSLLKALQALPRNSNTLWLNGDVVFDYKILNKTLPAIKNNQSFVVVDKSNVGEEEVKYTIGAEGFINKLSKIISVNEALGEAVGINFVANKDKNTLMKHLARVNDQDYFEKGIENAITFKEMFVEPIDISIHGYNAIEVDFEDDLQKALATFR